MYYKILYDTNKERIGECYPQTYEVKNAELCKHPQFIDNIGFKRTNNSAILPNPILQKKAISTDLISSIVNGTIGRLIISEKLSKILSPLNELDIEFLQMRLLTNEQKELSYSLINPFTFQMNYISYPASDIQVVTWGETFVRNIRINDFEDFKHQENTLVIPERLNIVKVVIRKEITADFFVLNSISGGGFCYFVSEKVKSQIEEQNCTGILFEPIETT